MTEETTAVEGTAQAQEQKAPGLSLTDILGVVQIIDVVTQRGAIKGEELVAVGTLRERFVAFLRHAKEQGQNIELPPSMNNASAADATAQ